MNYESQQFGDGNRYLEVDLFAGTATDERGAGVSGRSITSDRLGGDHASAGVLGHSPRSAGLLSAGVRCGAGAQGVVERGGSVATTEAVRGPAGSHGRSVDLASTVEAAGNTLGQTDCDDRAVEGQSG